MAYKDDIKNGKWQKLRLQVMNRDSFKCQACFTQDNLNVHHLYYEAGNKIWEYEPESLVTLCENCHNILHKDLYKVAGIIAFRALVGKLDLTQIGIWLDG